MNQLELMKILHLSRPTGKVKMILDTDTFNEIDDQFALAYALKSPEKLDLLAIYAAPFFNEKSKGPCDGMEKSYNEIHNVLTLMDREDMRNKVFKGSENFMTNENLIIPSNAADDLIKKALEMPDSQRLYVVAIGAITNVAQAILKEPKIIDKIVVVWLGGNNSIWKSNNEFNATQDTYSAKLVFDSTVPIVQIPCMGVTSHLATTEPELRENLYGKNKLCDYLYEITCKEVQAWTKVKTWSKVIWDVVAIAWLVGDNTWLEDSLVHSPIITQNDAYGHDRNRHFINQIQGINRDAIFDDLFRKLSQ